MDDLHKNGGNVKWTDRLMIESGTTKFNLDQLFGEKTKSTPMVL
jgi:hypothetical protein